LQNVPAKRLLIVGAGSAGEKLVREIKENGRLRYDLVGFIDDALSKQRLTIHGVKVLGPLQALSKIVEDFDVDELIIAAPTATAAEMRRMVSFCKSANVPFKTVPGMDELIDGRVSVSAIREVQYEDLLGRMPVEIDVNDIGRYLTGKRLMVTGAAGSIGSELCRQIASFKPSLLVIVDRNESGLYDIEMEFRAKYPALTVVVALTASRTGRSCRVFRPPSRAGGIPRRRLQACAHDGAPSLGGRFQQCPRDPDPS
jgi:FlaA1/EpsC-like NDP-sugar epimerase